MTAPDAIPTPPSGDTACEGCGKPAALCVCAAMAPVANRVHVLVLRHPQEQDKLLGTAGILTRQLERATLRTGLSWPNLSRALGADAEPRRWGALYLGAAKQAPPRGLGPLVAVDDEGAPIADQTAALAGVDGIVLLDGNWAQAKALWWRNAWLLKCRRFIVNPEAPSLYGALRREPRRESVSTLEAGALALAALERRPDLVAPLMAPFRLLLRKYRAAGLAPRPPDRRRRRRGG